MPNQDFPVTARMTAHARQRCLEMGITTARVKRVVRSPDLSYSSRGLRIVCRDDEPSFRVVVDGPKVVTVLPWSYDRYERAS